MRKEEIQKVSKIIDEIFNKYDKVSAKNTIKFHFKCKESGIDDGRKYWVAEVNKKIVGFIGSVNTIQSVFWLSWFGVKKDFQGKGIGKKLFEFFLNEAKRRKAKVICIEAGSAPMFKKSKWDV